MKFNKYDMFAYQLLDYLIVKHNYRVVRVKQYKEDIWLMNEKQKKYPVIRITSKIVDESLHDMQYIKNVHHIILSLIHREGKILILNTHPQAKLLSNSELKIVRVTPQEVSDKTILNTFQDIQQAMHDKEDVDKEIAVISKEIEEYQQQNSFHVFNMMMEQNKFVVTKLFIIICTLFTVLASVLSLYLNNDAASYVASGALYKMNVTAAHEYWRLLTAGFIQPNLAVLLLSMFVFFSLGKVSEHVIKRRTFLITICISILMGNVFTLIAHGNEVSCGFGGAIAGVMAAYYVHLKARHIFKVPLVKLSFMKLILMLGILMLFSELSVYAYLGGAISGLFIGMLTCKTESLYPIRKHAAASFVMLFAGCIVLSLFTPIKTFHRELDDSIIMMYRNTPLNSYADYLQRCYNKQYRLE